jgi:hypothetical protein
MRSDFSRAFFQGEGGDERRENGNSISIRFGENAPTTTTTKARRPKQ